MNGPTAPARAMDLEHLEPLIQSRSIDALSVSELVALFRDDLNLADNLPDGEHQVDPRDGAVVTFNRARARRLHDQSFPPLARDTAPCPICLGQTTGVLDVAPLSDGFTFINKNLFPIVRQLDPITALPTTALSKAAHEDLGPTDRFAYGLHFLQWTSSRHDDDWHSLPRADRVVVFQRLAALERKLLTESEGFMPISEPWNVARSTRGYVSIIKNYGRAVGGSLSHGHQQIAFSNIMPRRFFHNWQFFEQRREVFSSFLLRCTPPELVVRDYGAAALVVPYFMRRPYDMMLLVKDPRREYLSDLAAEELAAVADGWHDAMRAILAVMPRLGRAPAFNVTVNNGPGAGLYCEFLPFTQETGGFEHLGLWVCQDEPRNVAARVREALDMDDMPAAAPAATTDGAAPEAGDADGSDQ